MSKGIWRPLGLLLAESLTTYRDLDHRVGVAQVLEEHAHNVSALGDPLLAARLWGTHERLREDCGEPMTPNDRSDNDRCVAAARAALGDDPAFDRAWQEGRAMALDEAVNVALTSMRRAEDT